MQQLKKYVRLSCDWIKPLWGNLFVQKKIHLLIWMEPNNVILIQTLGVKCSN